MTTTSLTGQVLHPTDAGYDEARSVWNAMVDRRPALIVRCGTVTDVVNAIRHAREHDLEIGVRCGGHSVLGLAVPAGGLMIDLTPMGGVTVDPRTRRARVQGGALLGALDRAAQRHGLATTAGNVSHTGVGGLTLGGGMGWLARRFGLSCDNVVSFEVVTADGALVTASRTEHPELFWGLRGGGGNFGIVTSFEFQLHEIGTRALLASYLFDPADGVAVLEGWRELNAVAPREATYFASIGADGVDVGFVWVGDPERGRRLTRDLAGLGRTRRETVREMSYLDLQTIDDAVDGHHFRRYWKGLYLDRLPAEAAAALVERGDGAEALRPTMSLQAYGGAIQDVPEDEAAYGQRGTLFELVAAARWDDPAEDADRMAAARSAVAPLTAYSSGMYLNTLSDEGAAGVRRAFPPAKLARLAALKRSYDPANVFHLNQNIAPA
ncbi:FAD-linked oxidase [Asanoa ishikariensis]|uniref:FAD/FMN-containing dehydrogenase n=1 Tax=Asanoa ishikariensis TaxID=137265 RepID=A0A1H3MKT2_9ACTN|nr:FAD-binding oxidoreductase [Asanoa ishikariensis]GIF66196.1 FAD-linked oxidase [Asanoa ishikariensis]SDY77291.1 FAD/FMN-containing dehydrogenase [Asanoa ishikariensis]